MVTPSRCNPDIRSSLLLVDDDIALCEVLDRTLTVRGFEVRVARTAKQASRLVDDDPPQFAVIALKLPDASGLKLLSALLALDPHMRIVVLTSYPSIRTAVEAIKLGASDYLAKPANVDEVVSALQRDRGNDSVPIGKKPMSVHRAEWEYISQVLRENNGNISASARALSMDRRTLQRKLRKRPPRD
ncbi:MAG TPA: response regulator [Casimicrobiaceae bacterium]|nr:response regulator [Casimicrobiaceae bacterium]